MTPMQPELMELVYASKLLAKTIDEVDEKLADAVGKIEDHQTALAGIKEILSSVDKRLEVMPLVLANQLEALIEKRIGESYEDVRAALDELRRRLGAIREGIKQVKDQTGQHQLPTHEQLAQWEKDKEKEDSISVRKGRFRMDLPISEGTLRVLKIVGYTIATLAGLGGASGGIWVLIEHIKRALSGGN